MRKLVRKSMSATVDCKRSASHKKTEQDGSGTSSSQKTSESDTARNNGGTAHTRGKECAVSFVRRPATSDMTAQIDAKHLEGPSPPIFLQLEWLLQT